MIALLFVLASKLSVEQRDDLVSMIEDVVVAVSKIEGYAKNEEDDEVKNYPNYNVLELVQLIKMKVITDYRLMLIKNMCRIVSIGEVKVCVNCSNAVEQCKELLTKVDLLSNDCDKLTAQSQQLISEKDQVTIEKAQVVAELEMVRSNYSHVLKVNSDWAEKDAATKKAMSDMHDQTRVLRDKYQNEINNMQKIRSDYELETEKLRTDASNLQKREAELKVMTDTVNVLREKLAVAQSKIESMVPQDIYSELKVKVESLARDDMVKRPAEVTYSGQGGQIFVPTANEFESLITDELIGSPPPNYVPPATSTGARVNSLALPAKSLNESLNNNIVDKKKNNKQNGNGRGSKKHNNNFWNNDRSRGSSPDAYVPVQSNVSNQNVANQASNSHLTYHNQQSQRPNPHNYNTIPTGSNTIALNPPSNVGHK